MLIHPFHDELDRPYRRELDEAMIRHQLAVAEMPRRGLRRSVGQAMIRIGSRLAADPVRQRARPA